MTAYSSRDAGYVCDDGSVTYPKYAPFTVITPVARLTRN